MSMTAVLVEVGLGVAGQVGLLREVGAEQADGLFGGPALPGIAGSRRSVDVGGQAELDVSDISLPLSQVEDRRRWSGRVLMTGSRAFPHDRGGTGLDGRQHGVAGHPLRWHGDLQ